MKWLATLMLIFACTAEARGQDAFCDDDCDFDAQLFSPVNFDFDCRPIRKDCGYFFRYDKLNWAATGERIPLGDPNVTYVAQSPFTGGVIPGVAPTPYTIVNGISDTAPFASFAWGERYEFGKFNKNNGWQVTVLDGPEFTSGQNFGFGVNSNEEIDQPADGLGFGSVYIGFTTTNPDYFVGFVDLMQNDMPLIGVSISQLAGPAIITRFIDDVNGNGIFDAEDTILFFPVWEQVNVRNVTETNGVELMRTHQLNNRHQMVKRQGSQWGFGYGMRFFRIRDQFSVDAFGGVFGDSNWDTEVDNQIVGPQFQLQWEKQRGRWNFNAEGRVMLGYNIQDLDQIANFGSDLVPGGQNKPVFATPTVSSAGRRDDEFSPVGELRVEASYQVSSAIALRLGYTAMFIDNIRRAANQVRYELPNFGFRDGGTQDIFINGVNVGFDVVY